MFRELLDRILTILRGVANILLFGSLYFGKSFLQAIDYNCGVILG